MDYLCDFLTARIKLFIQFDSKNFFMKNNYAGKVIDLKKDL